MLVVMQLDARNHPAVDPVPNLTDRVAIDRDAVKMILGEPDHLHPELVSQPRLPQRLVDDPPTIGRVTTIRRQKIAESHEYDPLLPPCQSLLGVVSAAKRADAAARCTARSSPPWLVIVAGAGLAWR